MQTTNKKHLINDYNAVVDVIVDYGKRNSINVDRVIEILNSKTQFKIFEMHKYEGVINE